MSGFNSGQRVSKLEWDTTAHGGRKSAVPEPTQGAVDKYNRLAADVVPGGMAVLLAMPPEEQEAAADALKDAIAELCQGEPSREELDQMPARVLTAFMGWLYGELSNPTAPTRGTKR